MNMDLIAGLPADTPEGFRKTLDQCIRSGADNITVHTLALKKGSRLTLEGSPIPSAEAVAEMLEVMGLSEAKAFPSMPLRVTINEYVEVSKFYSTPKSRSFVNGLLDRLVKKQIEEGDIVKTEKIA